MNTETHRCPRRAEIGFIPTTFPLDDRWDQGTSFAGHRDDADFHNCSYCGSIHPDDFMAKVRDGWYVIPTDKNYKAYLAEPCEPYTIIEGTVTITHKDVGKFYYQHLSQEQRLEFIQLYNDKAIKLGEPGYFYSGLFFARFTQEEV